MRSQKAITWGTTNYSNTYERLILQSQKASEIAFPQKHVCEKLLWHILSGVLQIQMDLPWKLRHVSKKDTEIWKGSQNNILTLDWKKL